MLVPNYPSTIWFLFSSLFFKTLTLSFCGCHRTRVPSPIMLAHFETHHLSSSFGWRLNPEFVLRSCHFYSSVSPLSPLYDPLRLISISYSQEGVTVVNTIQHSLFTHTMTRKRDVLLWVRTNFTSIFRHWYAWMRCGGCLKDDCVLPSSYYSPPGK